MSQESLSVGTATARLVTSVGLSLEQIEMVGTLLASFLMSGRERYFKAALPIPLPQREALRSFFRSEILDYTRTHQLVGQSLQRPEFYPMLERMGFQNLPDFTTIEAITFEDVIVFAAPMTEKLLFHELVHAEQFRQLGVTVFARRYVSGFLNSGAYEAIPLEIQAYGLGAQYDSDPRRPFAVEEDVARWITEGRY